MAIKKNYLQIRLEYGLALTLIQLLQRLPVSLASRLAALTAKALDRSIPKLRRVAETNLTFAMPELTPEERAETIDGVFHSVGRLLLTFARFPSITHRNVDDLVSYEGLHHFENAQADGKGVLVATAHLGNWELSAFSHAWMSEPMHVMVRALDNPLIDAMVATRRVLSGNHLIYKKDAARNVLRVLRYNGAVGILIDQNVAASEGVFVEFFGRMACANSAFVKFAHHSGAKVIPGFAFWTPHQRRYVLRFYPAIPMTGNVVEDTQRIHTFLEQVIRQYPDQWMWIHRRWKTRPAGEPEGVYEG